MKQITILRTFANQAMADAAIRLLKAAGIQASDDPKDLGRKDIHIKQRGIPLVVFGKDTHRAGKILELSRKFELRKKKGPPSLPPEDGTLENLDMLIHDCRQYLMIATGELKGIEEEGELALDDPTNDIEKIEIRLKRLKDQCMGFAGRQPLDWQHEGGLNE